LTMPGGWPGIPSLYGTVALPVKARTGSSESSPKMAGGRVGLVQQHDACLIVDASAQRRASQGCRT